MGRRVEKYHSRARGSLLLLLAAGALLAWGRFRPFRVAVEGGSMAPTLEPGDFLVAVRARRLRPGVLAVLEHPDRPGFEMVKRLVRASGGAWWVEGDRAEGSTDSRSFGWVSASSIRGRAVLRYWPPGRWARLG